MLILEKLGVAANGRNRHFHHAMSLEVTATVMAIVSSPVTAVEMLQHNTACTEAACVVVNEI